MAQEAVTPVAEGEATDVKQSAARRRFLLGVTGAVGGVGGVVAVTPFVASLRPSKQARAEGAPIKMDVTGLAPGELRRDVWRLKPIWIFGRDSSMLDYAKTQDASLADANSDSSLQPEYCKNEQRSIRPDVFVAIGLCTHLGCSPGQAADKKDGFLCACHGSRFDVSGRVYSGSPAPSNLIIPPHRYEGDNSVIIGEDDASA